MTDTSTPSDNRYELREKIRKALISNMTLLSYEPSLDAIMSLIDTEVKKEVRASLDRLEEHSVEYFDWGVRLEKKYDKPWMAIPTSALEAERQRYSDSPIQLDLEEELHKRKDAV